MSLIRCCWGAEMRYDKNFAMFAKHTDWYYFIEGYGYVPTDEASAEAETAMFEYNCYSFWNGLHTPRGLRLRENEKFMLFFNLIQQKAGEYKAVFFADCGAGNVYENEVIECESLCGWLIPVDKISEFEPHFLANSINQHDYDDYYCIMEYKITESGIEAVILDYEKG